MRLISHISKIDWISEAIQNAIINIKIDIDSI